MPFPLVCSLGLVPLFVVRPPLPDGGDAVRLCAGVPVTLELAPGDGARELTVVLAADGEWTVDAASVHGDPYLVRLDASGATVERDDDGGVEWNARLVVAGAAGETLRMAAGFAAGEGTLRVELSAGAAASDDSFARAAFLRERGGVLLERAEALGPEAPGRREALFAAAMTLHVAGELDYALGEHFASLQSYREVYDLARELDHLQLGTIACAHIGAIHGWFEEHSAARSRLEQAAAYLAQPGFPDNATKRKLEMFVADGLGRVELAKGELAAARAGMERSLALAREIGAGSFANLTQVALARVEVQSGRFERAEELLDETVKAARALGESNVHAAALRGLAELRTARCQFESARELLAEAEAVATSRHTRFAIVGTRARLMLQTDQTLAALWSFTDVLEYARQSGARGLELAALQSIGDAAIRLGDYPLARLRLEEARALQGDEASVGARAEVLSTLARLTLREGDLESSQGLIDEARGLAHAAQDPALVAVVETLTVGLHYYREEYREALVPAQSVLRAGRELGLMELEATGLRLVAELSLRLGDLETARRDAAAAVAIFRGLGLRGSVREALLTNVEVARLDGDVARMEAIVAEAETCMSAGPQLEAEANLWLRAQESYALWGRHSQELVALQLRSAEGDAARRVVLEAGLRRAGFWKAHSLWQGIIERRSGARNPGATALRRELGDLRATRSVVRRGLQDARHEDSGGALAARARERLRELDAEEERVTRALREASPVDAALEFPEGVVLADLDRALGDHVLLEFVEGQDRLYAYRVRRGEIDFKELGELAALGPRVREYRAGMTISGRLASPREIARLGSALYDDLLAPLVADLSAGEPIVIVPSEALASLPFEALVVEAPSAPTDFDAFAFLLDEREVTYAASTPVLTLLAQVEPRTAPGRALVLADAVYRDAPSRPGEKLAERPGEMPGESLGRPRGWAELPGTRGEALVLAAELEAAARSADPAEVYVELETAARSGRSLSLTGAAFELHLGDAATPRRLDGSLREYAIVHCASHGWLDADNWHRSGLVLSPDEAGDDFLSVAEILDLDLDADLAVLSACETGSGAVRRAEGVLSLARAFQLAGARTVVASLWPVDDRATQAVMHELYARSVEPGRTISSALRDARLAVRGAGFASGTLRGRSVRAAHDLPGVGHPYYWASFVVSGLPDATLSID